MLSEHTSQGGARAATSCTSCPVLLRVITLYLLNMIPNSHNHVD